MTRTKVYIAGPYTKGDVAQNVARAMDAWNALWRLGYAPFCPHWSHFQHLHAALPYEDWLEFDLVWLPQCKFLLRLPGESSGADKEEEMAKSLGIPIFTSVEEVARRVYTDRPKLERS